MLGWLGDGSILNQTLEHGSYGFLVLVLILTGAGLPLPEEIPIVFAGVAAKTGAMNPWGALLSCFVGALIGDCVLYTIGYHFGHNLTMKHPRLAALLHAEREARIERWIKQHGLKILFVVRFMVVLRAPVYLAVGILRMPVRQFVLVDTFCAASVVGTFFGLSYIYGENIKKWIRGGEWLLTIVVLVCVGLALLWTWRRGKASAAKGQVPPGDPPAGVRSGS